MRAMSGVSPSAGGTHERCTITLFRTTREDALLRRVRGEYREMPGMRLTIEQAMRLWSIDRQACATAFNSLVASHYLEIDDSGRFGRAGETPSNSARLRPAGGGREISRRGP
jgi:hypothetical protein